MAAAACLAVLLALPAPAPPPAFGTEAEYTHLWLAETVLGGERGRTAKRVSRADLTLAARGDAVGGTLRYRDVLGSEDPSGFHAQVAAVELTLSGAFVEPGRSAGGTFEGTATLTSLGAGSLEEAVAPGIEARSDGVQVVYSVSGHWGATISEGRATGELLFERAEDVRRSAPDAAVHGPEWFNRLGRQRPGEPQTFSTALAGDAPEPPPAGGGPGGGGSPEEDGAPEGILPAEEEPGFWRYVLRGLGGGAGVRAVPASPGSAREARALRDAVPAGARRVPRGAATVDLDVSGAYLDALNRAAGLLADEGPQGFGTLAEHWDASRRAAPGRPAVPRDADPAAFHASRLLDALEGQEAPGASALASQARSIAQGRASGAVADLRTWVFAAEAVAGSPSAGSVAGGSAAAVRAVRDAPVRREGPGWDAALAAADSPTAPRSAIEVAAFARAPSADSSATASPRTLPGSVLARSGGRTLSWTQDGGRASVTPDGFPAYRRADGRVYWLAGEDGPAALTDGTLRGWAFSIPRAWLVDPGRVGRILADYPTG